MGEYIPFQLSTTNYRLQMPLNDNVYLLDIHWNSRDEAWYFDLLESDETPIALNLKVVLGIPLGRRSNHEFFDNHKLVVIDSSGAGIDATYDDLNTRIYVFVETPETAIGRTDD